MSQVETSASYTSGFSWETGSHGRRGVTSSLSYPPSDDRECGPHEEQIHCSAWMTQMSDYAISLKEDPECKPPLEIRWYPT